MRWKKHDNGYRWCPALHLALWLNTGDGWWYVMETNEKGDILEGVDALGWGINEAEAKNIAEEVKE